MPLTGPAARLWHALGIGPIWRERAPPAPAVHDGATALAQQDWEEVERSVAQCTACGLSRARTRTVFGAGNRTATWMFIGEAPGAEEDARGEPFVGQAGRLLDNMLSESGLGRDRTGAQAVYIANVIKCRPPGNRNPEPAEVSSCAPFLRRQIELLQPLIIVVLGRYAAQALLATDASIASLRGRVHEFETGGRRYPVIVTYHPAYLLRNLAEKSRSWDDLCLARTTHARLAAAQAAAAGAEATP